MRLAVGAHRGRLQVTHNIAKRVSMSMSFGAVLLCVSALLGLVKGGSVVVRVDVRVCKGSGASPSRSMLLLLVLLLWLMWDQCARIPLISLDEISLVDILLSGVGMHVGRGRDRIWHGYVSPCLLAWCLLLLGGIGHRL